MWETIFNCLESENYSISGHVADILFIVVLVAIIIAIIMKTIGKIKKKQYSSRVLSYLPILICILVLAWIGYSLFDMFKDDIALRERINNEEFDYIIEGEGEIELPQSGRIDHYILVIDEEEIYVDTGIISTQSLPVGEGKFKAYYINLDLGERIVPELVRIDKWIENDDS